MTLNQFNNLTTGRRVRLAGSTETGIIIAKSKYVTSALVRWTGGDVAWEEYYRLELADNPQNENG